MKINRKDRLESARIMLSDARFYLRPIGHHEIRAIDSEISALYARLREFGDGLELADAVGDDDPACTCRELGRKSCGKHGEA